MPQLREREKKDKRGEEGAVGKALNKGNKRNIKSLRAPFYRDGSEVVRFHKDRKWKDVLVTPATRVIL